MTAIRDRLASDTETFGSVLCFQSNFFQHQLCLYPCILPVGRWIIDSSRILGLGPVEMAHAVCTVTTWVRPLLAILCSIVGECQQTVEGIRLSTYCILLSLLQKSWAGDSSEVDTILSFCIRRRPLLIPQWGIFLKWSFCSGTARISCIMDF